MSNLENQKPDIQTYIQTVFQEVRKEPEQRKSNMEETFEEALRRVNTDSRIPIRVDVSYATFKRHYYGYTGKKQDI